MQKASAWTPSGLPQHGQSRVATCRWIGGDRPLGERRLGLVLLGAVAWQAWMTLTLFGGDQPAARLLNDEPIISGRHSLHLYHGFLGSRSLLERGTLCCYDPAFQGGYLKTPVFDGGSRPAELFLMLAAGDYRPAAYKIGLAASCLAVPLLLAGAAWGVGLGAAGAALAAWLAALLWWLPTCRQALEAGDVDVLLAGLAAVVFVAMLLRWHQAPGLCCWLGLVVSGALGWFCHLPLFALLAVPILIYYLSVGPRHHIGWHVAVLAALLIGPAVNYFWLTDWVAYWWLWVPGSEERTTWRGLTWEQLGQLPGLGSPVDQGILLALAGASLIGLILLNQTRRRPAARLLGLGSVGLLGLAVGGLVSESLHRLGTERLLVPGLLFLVVPAAATLAGLTAVACRFAGRPARAALLGAGLTAAVVLAVDPYRQPLARHLSETRPLEIGLGPTRLELVERLRQLTSDDARILWEDQPGNASDCGWTALLPLLTERAFLGGLNAHGQADPSYPVLVNHHLGGRALSSWSDHELAHFCRRYNVGWVVCWSAPAVARFSRSPQLAVLADTLPADVNGQPGKLFMLWQERSYVLKGQAQLLCAEPGRVALADVVPEDGQVVLSMHYLTGWQAAPGRVRIEVDRHPHDPVPFIRLRVPGPVTRLSLTWNPRE